MALKITDLKDLPRLNVELARLDLHAQQIAELRAELRKHQVRTDLESQTNGVPNQNNVVFTWTGALINWTAAYVKDHSGAFLPIAAGSRPLLASTAYWAAWNPEHQSMSFQTKLTAYDNIPNALIICKFFTGTSAQTGVAGGGGGDTGGSAFNAKEYSNF